VLGRAKDVSSTKNEQDRQIEAGGAGTEVGRTDDPLHNRAKEAMTPAKEKEYELTAVKRSKCSENCRARTSWNKSRRGSRKG